MVMAKGNIEKIKCDCRDCLRSGPIENYMCYCPIYGCKRSVGIRICIYFLKRNQ